MSHHQGKNSRGSACNSASEHTYTLGTTGTTWDGPLIDVEFGVWWHLYDVIPQRQKEAVCFTGKLECFIACRKVISDLKRPGLTVGRARKTHLGNMSCGQGIKKKKQGNAHM